MTLDRIAAIISIVCSLGIVGVAGGYMQHVQWQQGQVQQQQQQELSDIRHTASLARAAAVKSVKAALRATLLQDAVCADVREIYPVQANDAKSRAAFEDRAGTSLAHEQAAQWRVTEKALTDPNHGVTACAHPVLPVKKTPIRVTPTRPKP